MIDLHTHTLLSDGELLPSELARRAYVKGYRAIALTDHVDSSNIDFVLPRLAKVAKGLTKYWKIKVLPGVEITHAPLQEIKGLVRFARTNGAKIVVVHGETVSEPVIPGTNHCGIEAGCDILAHPGMILESDVKLAAKRGVCLEITTRKNHSASNKRLCRLATVCGARLVLDTDSHSDKDLISDAFARRFLRNLGLNSRQIADMIKNSQKLARSG